MAYALLTIYAWQLLMAYIHKHKDQWRAQVAKRGIRKTSVWPTKREAQEWAARLESEIAAGLHSDHGPHFTFGDAVDKYLADVSSKKDGEVWERRRLNTMTEYFGRDVLLTDIDAPQIAGWRDARLKEVSGSTVVREANILRNLFSVARLEWHWCDHKPFEGVKLPQENQPRQAIWGWKQIRRVLMADRSGKTREMQKAFHIALRTGMRLGEVLAAPANYDADKRIVTIKTKTEAAARIPIGRIADKLIRGTKFTVGANEGSVLFSRLCKELLIEGLTFHDARASALTWMAKKVDVLTLAKISRHKNLSLLSSVYYRESATSIANRI